MHKRLTQSKISSILKGVSFTLPPFLRHHLADNKSLVLAVRDRFSNKNESEVSIYDYFHFIYETYGSGVLNSIEFTNIRKKLIRTYYSDFYRYLITSHYKILKDNCSLPTVLALPADEFPAGYAEVQVDYIDIEEHKNQLREVFTHGKNVNYSNCIKNHMQDGNETVLVEALCSIKDTKILNYNINRIVTYNLELSSRLLFKIIAAPDSDVSASVKIIATKRLLKRDNTIATKILESIDPLIHTASYRRVMEELPNIYKSLFSDIDSREHQVDTIGKIRYLSKHEPAKAVLFIQNTLKSNNGKDDISHRCILALQSIALNDAGHLLFRYRFDEHLSKDVNKALQIWSSKNPQIIQDTYSKIHGQHEQSDLLRIVSNGQGLGNIRALLSLLPVLDEHHFNRTISLLKTKFEVMSDDMKNTIWDVIQSYLDSTHIRDWKNEQAYINRKNEILLLSKYLNS